MKTTVWKEKCIGNKLNIYTSIQCVVSRGVTLGKLGILQSGDCTQWGIHSHFLLKWSQNNKQFWVDSFITQIVIIYHLVYTGLSSWATSCRTKLISTTTNRFTFKKATSWSWKTEKGHWDQAPTQNSFSGITRTEEHSGAATFPPIVDWVDDGWAYALTGHR